jgi:hypothetical protein
MNKIIKTLFFIFSSNISSAEIYNFNISIIYVNSVKDIPVNKGYNYPLYLGYTTITPKSCLVYVVKPSSVADFHKMEILGHEVMHCTDKDYHK